MTHHRSSTHSFNTTQPWEHPRPRLSLIRGWPVGSPFSRRPEQQAGWTGRNGQRSEPAEPEEMLCPSGATLSNSRDGRAFNQHMSRGGPGPRKLLFQISEFKSLRVFKLRASFRGRQAQWTVLKLWQFTDGTKLKPACRQRSRRSRGCTCQPHLTQGGAGAREVPPHALRQKDEEDGCYTCRGPCQC